ncbi:MAG: hypothetical protein A4E58_01445 [Syntrophorhabdus sp. PtaB.Bin006]|nr:MAG: hypothetical protein A4E58_01445 [Syntrophorhabdus sp. PtaB.Bin006]
MGSKLGNLTPVIPRLFKNIDGTASRGYRAVGIPRTNRHQVSFHCNRLPESCFDSGVIRYNPRDLNPGTSPFLENICSACAQNRGLFFASRDDKAVIKKDDCPAEIVLRSRIVRRNLGLEYPAAFYLPKYISSACPLHASRCGKACAHNNRVALNRNCPSEFSTGNRIGSTQFRIQHVGVPLSCKHISRTRPCRIRVALKGRPCCTNHYKAPIDSNRSPKFSADDLIARDKFHLIRGKGRCARHKGEKPCEHNHHCHATPLNEFLFHNPSFQNWFW